MEKDHIIHIIEIFIKHQKEQAEAELKWAEDMVFGNDWGLGNAKGRLSLLRELEKYISAIELTEKINKNK